MHPCRNQGTIKSAVKGKAAEKVLSRIDSIMEEVSSMVPMACPVHPSLHATSGISH